MLKRIREAGKNEDGFTLIELLIVIVILGVLAGIVVFAVNGIQDRGETSACQSDVKTVTVAGEAYYAQNGQYAPDVPTLITAGLLRSVPDGVDYAIITGPPLTIKVTGKTPGPCAGFAG